MTALMYATQCGHKDIVKALVERKANLNITAVMVGLCLHVWIMYHCSLCVQTSGWTAMHLASKEGLVEISRMLIEGGADMDIKDKVSSLVYLRIVAADTHSCIEWSDSS